MKYVGFPLFPIGKECLVTENNSAPIIMPISELVATGSSLMKKEKITPRNVEAERAIFIFLFLGAVTGSVLSVVYRNTGMKNNSP